MIGGKKDKILSFWACNYNATTIESFCEFLWCTLPLFWKNSLFQSIVDANQFQACVGKPESGNATVFLAKTGVMVLGVSCVDHENWGPERDIERSWQNSVFCTERFGKYLALYVHLAYKDVDLFPKGSVLDSWDNNWANHGTDKNRQSMTPCGYCCYYLEHCSKINHIAIKWTKYENVYRLLASHKNWWSPNF